MSGSLRLVKAGDAADRIHDHWDMRAGQRLGPAVSRSAALRQPALDRADPALHPLLAKLAPEPLSDGIRRRVPVPRHPQTQRRHQATHHEFAARRRRGQHLRQRSVVSREASRRGARPAGSRASEAAALARAIKDVLGEAIKIGGTTLRDYVNADGAPGYFRQKLFVYERAGAACRVCKSPVKQFVQGQRSTYWCSTCQR